MSKKYYMQWSEVKERLQFIDDEKEVIYGIPRGGMCMVAALEKARVTIDPNEATIIVDDIITSGQTRDKWLQKYPHAKFWAMINQKPCEKHPKTIYNKIHNDDDQLPWVVFPFELDKDETIEEHLTRIHELCVTQQQFHDGRYQEFLQNMNRTLQQYREKYKYF